MIASIAAAGSSSNALSYAIDRAGQAFGPSSLQASTDLDDVLADFELPPPVLEELQVPFEQLGFTVAPGTLSLEAHLPSPPRYTEARRGPLQLALIRLPDILFEPNTTATVLIGNLIGYAFQPGARLHLFAIEQREPTESLGTAMRSWARVSVAAVFHPWTVIEEFESAPDRTAYVQRVFEVPDSNGAGPAAAVPTFGSEHRTALHAALLKAFPSYDELQLMLRLHVNGRQLAEIIEPTKLGVVVLAILDAAEAQGWIRDLIAGARAANPGNPDLTAAAALIPAALGGEGS
jgi:hypothetical protein